MDTTTPGLPRWRVCLYALVENPRFKAAILALIVLNAVTLGLETWASLMVEWGGVLRGVDVVVVAIFAVEVALRIAAHGRAFFRDGWSVFDLAVVALALVPAGESFTVLRALRVLRVFRLVSAIPAMRRVVAALLGSIPGLGAIVALMLLIFYVFAVMATKLFGASNPDTFGTLGHSLFSLFQLMTLEGWTTEIVKPVLEHHGWALAFFLPFMLLSTFVVLNLFIALIVDSMQKLGVKGDAPDDDLAAQVQALADEVRALRSELRRASP